MKKQDLNLELTPKLRYERISPADMKFTDAVPTWTQPADNIDESILALLDEEWHTDHIKAELLRLHFQPLDRSRQALGEQLVSEFVNPDRITTSLQSLSEEVYTFYLYLLLLQSLVYKFTTPASLETIFPGNYICPKQRYERCHQAIFLSLSCQNQLNLFPRKHLAIFFYKFRTLSGCLMGKHSHFVTALDGTLPITHITAICIAGPHILMMQNG